jgi:hypothetical protein
MASKKTRLLGAGYTLEDAIAEIDASRNTLPDLAAQTLPALLLHVLEAHPSPEVRLAARGRLQQALSLPGLSEPVRALMRMAWARVEGRWADVLDQARQCRLELPALLRPGAPDPGYGCFYMPIQLGQALNGDLNRGYREYLERGDHSAFADLLNNLALAAAAAACLQSGRPDEAGRFATEMSPGRWTEATPWPLLFAVCLVAGDIEALDEVIDRWLEDYPLDVPSWERILRGLRALNQPERAEKFLAVILPAARQFLKPEKLRELEALAAA